MLRLVALILLAQVTHPIRTAHVTNAPSLVARLDKIYEKLERLTVAPTPDSTPINLSDDEEELLSAMQTWGGLTPDQLNVVAKDLQRIRYDADEERTDRMELDYADIDETDEEYSDYHNDDGKEDEDDEELEKFSSRPVSSPGEGLPASNERPRILEESHIFNSFIDDDTETSSSVPLRPAVTPSAITKDQPYQTITIISAVDPIAATNERPRIMDNSALTAMDRKALRTAALANMGRVLRLGKCLVPQPRWLSVRQLAPASDTMFMPPCVELHRCAPDSGCCDNEADVCAPIDGRYVAIPFYLHKADGTVNVARMMFFNHTTCACVARDTLQTTVPMTNSVMAHSAERSRSEERQNDWRPPTPAQGPTVEPKLEDDITAPPQMRRCTCPKYFQASMSDTVSCSCGCTWPDVGRRRECLYFSRGKEHLGLRDRVCIDAGDCAPPVCDYGSYDMRSGKCPVRKYRRLRYHVRRHHEKNVV